MIKNKWRSTEKMPSNDKPLLYINDKKQFQILYAGWKERDSFEKWWELCAKNNIRKWCYFEMEGMNYFNDILKQNISLQAELDKKIENNRKLVKVLKRYADPNFYDVVADQLDDGEMISEDSEIDLALKDISTFIGSIPVGCLARKTLKEVGEEE